MAQWPWIHVKGHRAMPGIKSWGQRHIQGSLPRSLLCVPPIIANQPTMASHDCRSVVKSRPTLCEPMDCGMPGIPVPHYLPEFAQVYVHWIGDVIQPFHPLLPSFPLFLFQSIPASVFSNELGVTIRWPKYWRFSFMTISADYFHLTFSFYYY